MLAGSKLTWFLLTRNKSVKDSSSISTKHTAYTTSEVKSINRNYRTFGFVFINKYKKRSIFGIVIRISWKTKSTYLHQISSAHLKKSPKHSLRLSYYPGLPQKTYFKTHSWHKQKIKQMTKILIAPNYSITKQAPTFSPCILNTMKKSNEWNPERLEALRMAAHMF